MKGSPATSLRTLAAKRIACVLCARPSVVCAYDSDFIKFREVFESSARANPGGCMLVQLGWECETPEAVARLAAALEAFRAGTDGERAIVLCNAPAEEAALGAAGAETRWIHQNALLDERRFRPMGGDRRPFDAAYIARLTPFKRHALLPVELAPRLLFLGSQVRKTEREFGKEMRARYAAARWIDFFSGAKISCYLAQAKCGLALSAAEGACFASAEYLLSGLPVVDTPAIGGRDVLYPEEFVRRVEAVPEAVADGIAHWVAHRPDPWKVRAAFLAKAAPHREKFRQLMGELTGRACGRPPHKLGLRTPHPGLACTLAINAYLRLKGPWTE
jgi:glycosyltransferase involved in cell wall biosynthesis